MPCNLLEKKKKSATGDKKNKCKHKCFQGKMYNSLPALHSYALKRSVQICSICQTDFFSFQIWRWRRCDCGGSDMAPIWSWLSCSISLNCHKYFSDTSNIFVPMWLLGSRLGADMIATWRRYDWHLACENRQYRKIWQIYQVLVLLYLYTLYCIEHCRLINI